MTSEANNPATGVKLSTDQVSIPATNVSVYQALYQRRMAWQFKNEAVSRNAVDRMLEAAVWAPNHRMTEPWRFFVLEKESDARQKAADLAYEFSMQRNNNPARAEAARQAVLDPPIVMYVYCVPGPNEEVTQENYAAVCCAVHNISLAGVPEGVAVTWETGGITRHPDLKAVLGAEEEWTMVTMLSIGVPAETPDSRRTQAAGFVKWFRSDQEA